jgi:hypothetical protein
MIRIERDGGKARIRHRSVLVDRKYGHLQRVKA